MDGLFIKPKPALTGKAIMHFDGGTTLQHSITRIGIEYGGYCFVRIPRWCKRRLKQSMLLSEMTFQSQRLTQKHVPPSSRT